MAEAAELERGQLVDAEGGERGHRRHTGQRRDDRRPAPRTPRPRRRRRRRPAPRPAGSRRRARRGGRRGEPGSCARRRRRTATPTAASSPSSSAPTWPRTRPARGPSCPASPTCRGCSPRRWWPPTPGRRARPGRRRTPAAAARRGSGRAASATSAIRPTRRTCWRTRCGLRRSSRCRRRCCRRGPPERGRGSGRQGARRCWSATPRHRPG